MSKPLEQIEKELDAKIPRSVVSERDGGGGRRLSYLEGWYVIDQLNKIFGPLGWSKEIIEIKEIVNKTARGEFPAYIVKVKLTLQKEGLGAWVVKEAYGYGADKSSQNAHELAIKEAVTDALKVAAKDLGMSLGLALYDKEQTNVDDGQTSDPLPVKSLRTEIVEAPAAKAEGSPDSEKLRTVIRSHVKAAIKKGVLTMEAMKAWLVENYKVDSLDVLDSKSLSNVLKYVQELTK